jgi:hypothetical protein
MTHRSSGFRLAALAVAVAVSGCASVAVPGETGAGQVAVAFHRAVAAGSMEEACRLLARATEQSVAGDEPCAEAIDKLNIPAADQVTSIREYGRQSQVRMLGDVVFLTVEAGAWRIWAAGCEPGPGGVYQCEVQK